MTSPRPGPSPAQRASATLEEARSFARLTGVQFLLEDLPSLLDPRGLRFQRLEWLGDSVLDALLALHARPRPACCSLVDPSELCTDRVLARRAEELGLPGALDWVPSPSRCADLVEACVGAAWVLGPAEAARCASRLVHPGLGVGPVLPPRPPRCSTLRPDALLGSTLLEAACALLLLGSDRCMSWDEGALSIERGRLLCADRLVRNAARLGWVVPCAGGRRHVLDHHQARVGVVGASGGLVAGLSEATLLLA